MSVHTEARDKKRSRGLRLHDSLWAEVEAIRLRRGLPSTQEALEEAVQKWVADHQRENLRSLG